MTRVLLCLLWISVITAAVLLTIKYYLPRLRQKNTKSEDETPVLPDQKKSNVYYLMVVLISAAVAGVCGYFSAGREDEWISVCKMILALGVLNIVSLTDMEFYKITNPCVLALIIGRCASMIPELICNDGTFLLGLINSLIAAVACLLFLLIMSKITHGGIGYGDVKLFGALGFLCGARGVVYTFIISFFLSAIVSVVLLLVKKKKLKDDIPMGPFIWLGFAATVVWGLC